MHPTMADYAEDPVGDVCAFTPINIVKEESTIVEPKMASIKTEIKDEDVSILSTTHSILLD